MSRLSHLQSRVAAFIAKDKVPESSDPHVDDRTGKRFALSFALVALVVGFAYVVLIPPFQVPDEAAHLYRAYGTSNFTCVGEPMIKVPSALTQEQDRFPALLENYSLQTRLLAQRAAIDPIDSPPLEGSDSRIEDDNGNLYSCVPYLPTAVVFVVGRFVRAPALLIYYSGKLANLLVYVALLSLSLLILPGYRPVLMVVALLPMTLQQVGSFPADSLTISLSFLLFAYCLHLAFGNYKLLGPKQFLILLALFVALSLCKFNIWFLLIILIIPTSRFGSKRRQYLVVAGLLFLMLGVAGVWQAVNAANIIRFEALKSKTANVDMKDNVRELSHRPDIFLETAVKQIETSYPEYINMFVGQLGPLTVVLPFWLLVSFKVLLVATTGLRDRLIKLNQYSRLLLLLISLASLFSIFSLLWIFETSHRALLEAEAGNGVLSGFQGRYFIPLAPLVLVALSWGRIRMGRNSIILLSSLLFLLNSAALYSVEQHYYGDLATLPKARFQSGFAGSLIKTSGVTPEDGKIYIVAGGKKHWITDGAWIAFYGFRVPNDLRIVSKAELTNIPTGSVISTAAAKANVVLPLPPQTAATRYEGKIVRSVPALSATQQIFFVSHGIKHFVSQDRWGDRSRI